MFDTHSAISTTTAERKQTELQPGANADNSHVREVLIAAATRTRNLSVATLVGTSALAFLAFSMTWSGLGVLAFGTMLYGSLVARDSVSESFLTEVFSFHQDSDDDTKVSSVDPPVASLEGLEGDLLTAYQGVLLRRRQLQERIDAGPAILKASVPEVNQICDTLLINAQRLVLRGQRLHAYLQSNKLTDLSDSAAMVAMLGTDSTDCVAAGIYRQIVSGKRRQIATHVEVEGLYERVLAQLMLIETTLAGAIASFVKITAADDEESSFTAYLITKQLEVLVCDVACLEQSLDEVAKDDAASFIEKLPAQL